jgi:hypothetical protein
MGIKVSASETSWSDKDKLQIPRKKTLQSKTAAGFFGTLKHAII